MRNKILSLCTLLLSFHLSAQIEVPQPSPTATHEQVVGLTNVTLKYSRPGMRGRTIFGDLVPYNQKWRTGANNNTTISFDTKVTIDGKELTPGTYAIYTIPKPQEWEVLFYKDTTNWGLPQEWDESKVALSTSAKVIELPMDIETFTVSIDDLSNDSANLYFLWENTLVILPFEVPTEEIAMASIEETMKGNPTVGEFYSAASYYHDENKDLEKAYEWIKKAVDTENPPFYVLRRKALIEADLGKTKEAIATAKESMAAAEEAGNQEYVKMNKESLKEWGAE